MFIHLLRLTSFILLDIPFLFFLMDYYVEILTTDPSRHGTRNCHCDFSACFDCVPLFRLRNDGILWFPFFSGQFQIATPVAIHILQKTAIADLQRCQCLPLKRVPHCIGERGDFRAPLVIETIVNVNCIQILLKS